MSPGGVAGNVVLALVGFGLTGMYAGLETGLYTLNRVRLAVRAGHGQPRAVRLRRDLRNPQRILTVLLVGTNASSYVGTYGTAEVLHATGLSDWTLVIVEAAVVTPILFVFAEILPKDLFRTHTDRWTYWLAPFVTVSRALFIWTGLVPAIELVTGLVNRAFRAHGQHAVTARQRISQLFQEGAGAGVLTSRQITLTDRALAMREHLVGRVMVPWRRVAWLPIDADVAARELLLRSRRFTRIPVVDEGRVVGVVSWSDALLDREAPIRDLMQPAPAFPPRTRLLSVLSVLRDQRSRLAVIEDPETGRPLGLVTLKDLVEPLTGELGVW